MHDFVVELLQPSRRQRRDSYPPPWSASANSGVVDLVSLLGYFVIDLDGAQRRTHAGRNAARHRAAAGVAALTPRVRGCRPAPALRKLSVHEHPDPRRRPRRRERGREPGVGANDITLVDTDPRRLRELQDRLDLRGVTGSGIQPSVLRDAGAADADMLIACAPLDETNLVACKLAHAAVQHADDDRAPALRRSFLTAALLMGAAGFAVDQVICPGGDGDALHRQADRVPRGVAGARVRRRQGQPDRGARGRRRADGAAIASPSCRSSSPAPNAHRRDLSAGRARHRPPDRLRRRHAHRARRRGVRARRQRDTPRPCSMRCAVATEPVQASHDCRRRQGRPAAGAPDRTTQCQVKIIEPNAHAAST